MKFAADVLMALLYAVIALALLIAASALLPMSAGAVPILLFAAPITAGRHHDSFRMGAYVFTWLVLIIGALLHVVLTTGDGW